MPHSVNWRLRRHLQLTIFLQFFVELKQKIISSCEIHQMPTFSVTAYFENTYQNLYFKHELSVNSKMDLSPWGKRSHRCPQRWQGSTLTSQDTVLQRPPGPGWWQGWGPLTACWSSDRARCQVQSKVNPGIQLASQDYLHHGSDGALGLRIHWCGTLVMLVRAVKACWHTPVPGKRPSEFHKFLYKVFCLMAKAASHFFKVFTAAFYIDSIANGFSWENITITQTKKCARSFALNWIFHFYNSWLTLS